VELQLRQLVGDRRGVIIVIVAIYTDAQVTSAWVLPVGETGPRAANL
jgi:hypothetical protein